MSVADRPLETQNGTHPDCAFRLARRMSPPEHVTVQAIVFDEIPKLGRDHTTDIRAGCDGVRDIFSLSPIEPSSDSWLSHKHKKELHVPLVRVISHKEMVPA